MGSAQLNICLYIAPGSLALSISMATCCTFPIPSDSRVRSFWSVPSQVASVSSLNHKGRSAGFQWLSGKDFFASRTRGCRARAESFMAMFSQCDRLHTRRPRSNKTWQLSLENQETRNMFGHLLPQTQWTFGNQIVMLVRKCDLQTGRKGPFICEVHVYE